MIRCRYVSENARYAAVDRLPPQVSNSISACAPASIWALRQAVTASEVTASR